MKFLPALISSGLLAAGLAVGAGAPAATADTKPPNQQRPVTVSADPLPTVQIDGVAWSQAIVGNKVFAGGSFATARPAGAALGVNTTPRSNLLAYDLTTGELDTSFAPDLDGQVLAVTASPDGRTLYVGGDFTRVNGEWHSRIAAFDVATGNLISTFRPMAGSQVRAIAATDAAVYFGGTFTSVNGAPRPRAAAVSPAGDLLPWNPSADATVAAITVPSGFNKVVLGGRFTTVGGAEALGLAAVDPVTAARVTWNTTSVVRNYGSDASITSLSSQGDSVYGTAYNFHGTGTLEGVFKAAATNGDVTWIADCHGDHYSAFPMGDVIYASSHAHNCGNLVDGFPQSTPWSYYHSTAMTTATAGTLAREYDEKYVNYEGTPSPALLVWSPTWYWGSYTGQNQSTWNVTGNGRYVVYGGEFPGLNGRAQQGLVRFAMPDIAPNKNAPNRNSGLDPSLQAVSPGAITVGWQADFDRDNEALTYRVYRNFTALTNTPIHETTVNSTFWRRPTISFTDTDVVPGTSYSYTVAAVDPFGNVTLGQPRTITAVGAAGARAYPAAVLADRPTHFYRLDESSGDQLVDAAGSSPMLSGGGLSRGVSGALDEANPSTFFNGSGSGYAVGQVPLLAPTTFSVEAWVRTTSGAGGKIVGFGSEVNGTSAMQDRSLYMSSSGRILFGVNSNGAQVVTSPGSYNDGRWHHLVGSFGPDGMKLSVDGRRVASRQDITRARAYMGAWHIGGDTLSGWPSAPASNYLDGAIDEVAIYPTVLTRVQVNAHYVASGRTSALPARPTDAYGASIYDLDPDLYWRLDESTGGTAADSSMAANAGSVSGGVSWGATGALQAGSSRAATFDGRTGSVVASLATSDPHTYSIGAWVRTTSEQGGTLIGLGSSASGQSPPATSDRQLYLRDDGRAAFRVGGSTPATITSSRAINDGNWHQVTGVQSAAGMRLYVDGLLAGTSPVADAGAYNGHWRIGSSPNGVSTSAYLEGSIDEAFAIPSALTSAQAAGMFTGAQPPTPNAVPVADFTATSKYRAVSVDGSASADSDGRIVAYAWDFGDGSTATGARASHTYAANGTFRITLRVMDDKGAHDTLTRSITVAASTAIAEDEFERTTPRGFGTADIGGAWSIAGSSANFSVSGGAGSIVLGSGIGQGATLGSVRAPITDARAEITLDRLGGGNGTYVSLSPRGTVANGYRVKARISPSGTVTLYAVRVVAGIETTLGAVSPPGLVTTPGSVLNLRVRAAGTGRTTLQVKAWRGTTEPGWQLTTADSTPALQTISGVTLFGYLSSSATNGPVTLRWRRVTVQPA